MTLAQCGGVFALCRLFRLANALPDVNVIGTVDAYEVISNITTAVGVQNGGGAAEPAVSTGDASMAPYFANNGFGKPVRAISEHGLNDGDITYVAYQGPHEDPYIVSYNHTSTAWVGPIQAGVSLMGRTPDNPWHDSHGSPAMVMDKHGYIHLSFGAHGGDKGLEKQLGINRLGNSFNSANKLKHGGVQTHVRSKRPRDITEWMQMESGISWNGCYPSLLRVGHDLVSLVRHGAHESAWTYQISRDDGFSFEPAKAILRSEARDFGADSWYCKFATSTKRLIVMCSYHKHQDKPRHGSERYNIYYMEMDVKTEKWYDVTGRRLGANPNGFSKSSADKKMKVLDTENHEVFKYRFITPIAVSLDEANKPHLLFSIAMDGETEDHWDSIGKGETRPGYMQWTGDQWTTPHVLFNASASERESHQFGDLCLGGLVGRKAGKALLTLSFQNSAEVSEVSTWKISNPSNSRDKLRIKKVNVLHTQQGSVKLSGTILRANEQASVVMSSRYGHSSYNAMGLLGVVGPIYRLEADAHICEDLRRLPNRSSVCVEQRRLV